MSYWDPFSYDNPENQYSESYTGPPNYGYNYPPSDALSQYGIQGPPVDQGQYGYQEQPGYHGQYGYQDQPGPSGYVGHSGYGNHSGDEVGDNVAGDKVLTGPPDKTVCCATDKIFSSREELYNWIFKLSADNGYVCVNKRSKKNKHGEVQKIWIACDRGGVYKGEPRLRKTGTKKTNCPFEIIGKYKLGKGGWIVEVVSDKHNHEPSEFLEGHPHAMKLTPDELEQVATMTNQHMEPRNILLQLKKQNPDNKSGLKNIYNARQKLKKEASIGETPMQVFFHALAKHNYIYTPCVDEATNSVTGVFFIHPASYELWRAFPHVLLIDATYKTNQYRMPFVQMVGVTSTNLTFAVAFAFIDSEREENYTWVLQELKGTLEEQSIEPRVIVTDRELALMNACDSVFPDAVKLLCRWHIFENISRHCRASFPLVEEWGRFEYLWGVLINSESESTYSYNYDRLHKRLIKHQGHVLLYLKDNWLEKYKGMFVTAWIDNNRNFGQRTTNRVESQHHNLKSYLQTTNSTLDRFIPFINKIVAIQMGNIKESFTESKIRRMNAHNDAVLTQLRGKVSHRALDLIAGQLVVRHHLYNSGKTCEHRLQIVCGLPCACHLDNYIRRGEIYTF